ncbi:cell division protein FtsB [Candidatus Palibaumannia cicadellinicola]|nr:cell division protein FtsB [Candidatus Baumannia cicadellinicola]
MNKLALLLLVLFFWLQYSLWLGKNGIIDLVRIDNNIVTQNYNNAKLKMRNTQLFAEVDDLNDGQDAIEERSRHELDMIKPGETFYRLVPRQQQPMAQVQRENK